MTIRDDCNLAFLNLLESRSYKTIFNSQKVSAVFSQQSTVNINAGSTYYTSGTKKKGMKIPELIVFV